MATNKNSITIPASMPKEQQQTFIENYQAITKNTDRLFLFSADQKMEHLHEDFHGENLPKELGSPEYLFDLATSEYIGAFATHLGLISRYAPHYPNINYIAKLNGRTPLVSTDQSDPISHQLWTVDDVLNIKQAGIPIRGVGYTVYIGSDYETLMLNEAAKIIQNAHKAGLVTILWIYPRGQAVDYEQDGMLAAGAAGVATSLGSDFVKIKPPIDDDKHTEAEWLKIAQRAAGTTRVICSGQEHVDATKFLEKLHEQLHEGTVGGAAIGRNIFQRPKQEAQKFMQAVSALIYQNADIETALDTMKKE